MAVSYTDTLLTDRDKIRFKVQDTVENSGPKPNGGNFSDNEIAGMLTIEGTVNRTVAALFEALASIWGHYVDTRIGPRDEKLSQIAERYAKIAQKWRDEYGYGDDATTLSAGYVTRQDGYSDDIDAGQE